MDAHLRERLARLHQTHVGQYSIVSLDPPIFCIQVHGDGLNQFVERYRMLFSALRGRPAFALCCHSFNLSSSALRAVAHMVANCREQFPDLQLTQLCNEPHQPALFREMGIAAEFCNKNCFVDDSLFMPMPSITRRFDAVYDARLLAFKRHHLAYTVANLALIYYPVPSDDPAYVREVRERLSHAHWFNHADTGAFRLLSRPEINERLAACRVGLCLSAEEGQMLASIQYLLAGLPVVTTPSQGGRDVFFEDRFVITADPEPGAIQSAVRALIQRAIPPDEIRHATLQRIAQHRHAFFGVVQRIYDQLGVRRTFADEWPTVFVNTMMRNQLHSDTLSMLAAQGRAAPAS